LARHGIHHQQHLVRLHRRFHALARSGGREARREEEGREVRVRIKRRERGRERGREGGRAYLDFLHQFFIDNLPTSSIDDDGGEALGLGLFETFAGND
jgi:hypothetical protein